jgi:hypothetical protein
LAGPTTIAARQSGQGISWLFPFTVITWNFITPRRSSFCFLIIGSNDSRYIFVH